MQKNPENSDQRHPDRPLECSECRKPIAVHYTEIVGSSCTHIAMCAECPQLQRKLNGSTHEELLASTGTGVGGLVCGECGTTLDGFRITHQVGCSHCYDVFGDLIVDEMLKLNKISSSITKRKKSVPLHVGRSPGETHEISPSLRLIALNEALEDTLQREDYEQAAWLRDQIKALTGGETEEKNAAE